MLSQGTVNPEVFAVVWQLPFRLWLLSKHSASPNNSNPVSYSPSHIMVVAKVYCRGARPRPWGPLRLLLSTAHSTVNTRNLLPAFPLLVREDITLKQVVQCGCDLRSLEQYLKKEAVKIQLVQGDEDLILAQLTTSMARLVFPKYPIKWLRDGVEMELVLTPTSRFQSAVGPRMEVSSRFVIEYSQEERMRVVDVTPSLPQHRPCQCLENQPPPPTQCHNHMSQSCRHGYRPETSRLFRGLPHHCDICDTYDMLVARRFSGPNLRPYSMKL